MRAGVLQLSRWGLLDRLVAAGTPPVRSTTFRDRRGATAARSRSPTGRAWTRCTPRAGTCSTGCWSTRPPRPARRSATAPGSPGCSATPEAGSPASRMVDGAGVETLGDGDVRRGRRRHPVARRGRRGGDACSSRAGTPARSATPTSAGSTSPGYEWGYGNGAAAGLIPTNDGEHCVFVATSPQRMRTLRLGRSADEVLRPPGRAGRAGPARAARRGPAGQPAPRLGGRSRASGGSRGGRVGAGGRRRLLQGPDRQPRHHRRAAGRRAAWPGRCSTPSVAGTRARRSPTTTGCGTRCRRSSSTSPTRSRRTRGTPTEVQRLLRRLSAAMTDEVELLESLPAAGRRAA